MSSQNTVLERPVALPPQLYWEDRAHRYAFDGDGLAAVCSYGMPAFYNRAIDLTQRLALRPWLKDIRGKRVLDVGCGVGRWSRWMAAAGAQVTGVDLSNTMIREAMRRATLDGLSQRCQFLTQDLAGLETGAKYEFILGVTVLQHILDVRRLEAAVIRLRNHLAPGGRVVLIEAAPTRSDSRCDSSVFRARSLSFYLDMLSRTGLRVETITGVDPMPLKTYFLPYYRRLPRPLALAGLFAATALSLPVDAVLGRRFADASWHKVIALQHGRGHLA